MKICNWFFLKKKKVRGVMKKVVQLKTPNNVSALCYCKRRNSSVWFIYFLQPCEPQRIFIVFSNLNNTFGLLLASLSWKVFQCLMNVKVFTTTLGIKFKFFLSHATQSCLLQEKLWKKNLIRQWYKFSSKPQLP